MITVSLCMIVKNEEAVLARCLESVKDLMDEIVIVDTGSTDATKDIAKMYTDKVYDFPWIDDFAAARNYSYSQATQEYIMWLDADDVLLEEARSAFKKLKETLSSTIDVVMAPYDLSYDGDKVTFGSTRERLTRRDKEFKWGGVVHECLEYSGKVFRCDVHVSHKKVKVGEPGRNLKIYNKLVESGRPMTPREIYYYARELKDHGMFEKASVQFEAFLETGKGYVEDNINSCLSLAECYQALGKPVERLMSLIRSFEYDTPRGEICCHLGYFYFEKGQFDKAAAWYRIATQLEKPQTWGFLNHDCWGFIPHIQLCVCLDRLGRREEAVKHNEIAANLKPNSPAVAYNRSYFAKTKAKAENVVS